MLVYQRVIPSENFCSIPIQRGNQADFSNKSFNGYATDPSMNARLEAKSFSKAHTRSSCPQPLVPGEGKNLKRSGPMWNFQEYSYYAYPNARCDGMFNYNSLILKVNVKDDNGWTVHIWSIAICQAHTFMYKWHRLHIDCHMSGGMHLDM